VVNQLPNKASSAGDARSDKPTELAEVTGRKEHSMAALIGYSVECLNYATRLDATFPQDFPK